MKQVTACLNIYKMSQFVNVEPESRVHMHEAPIASLTAR